MPRGEQLFRCLAGLMVDRFYGSVTIKLEAGRVTHVEVQTRRTWQYGDLPGGASAPSAVARDQQTVGGFSVDSWP